NAGSDVYISDQIEKRILPPFPTKENSSITKTIADSVGTVYRFAHELRHDFLSFWVGVVFLLLAIGSYVLHSGRGGQRVRPPLALPCPADSLPGPSPVALNRAEPEPAVTTVDPVDGD